MDEGRPRPEETAELQAGEGEPDPVDESQRENGLRAAAFVQERQDEERGGKSHSPNGLPEEPRVLPEEESDSRRRAQRREEGEGEEHLEFQGSGQEEGRHREPGGPVRPQGSRECGETRPKDRQPGKEGIDVDEIDEMESEKGVPPLGDAPEKRAQIGQAASSENEQEGGQNSGHPGSRKLPDEQERSQDQEGEKEGPRKAVVEGGGADMKVLVEDGVEKVHPVVIAQGVSGGERHLGRDGVRELKDHGVAQDPVVG